MQGAYGYRPTYPTTYMPQMYGQQQMPQQMQQQMMQPSMQQPMVANYICRPVASEDEARAVPTDFTGATLVLVDGAHGCIYTKSLNPMDGTALFGVYRLDTTPPAQEQPTQYAQAQEVEQLRQEIAELRASLTPKKPAAKGGSAE